METTNQNPIKINDRHQQSKPPSPSTSPNSSSTNSNSSSSSKASPSSSTPKSNPNPNPNSSPYPTTFIQADTQSFKQVVQLLTGSPDTAAKKPSSPICPSNPKSPIPPISKPNKKPPFKLYERRNSMRHLKLINSNPSPNPSRSQPEILSPSILNFPALVLSPVTPLSPDPFNRSPVINDSSLLISAEERAIADKGFYLHPSPRNSTPKLLPLFPLTSPRMESAAAAAESK